jgi:hypothetical protein
MKSWATLPGYHEFIKKKGISFQVNGWGWFCTEREVKAFERLFKGVA